ncbi:MAG: squalene--hopene cyclase [Candidatus Omnitrophica bacterium]|nr:squalene--hopene cyclase [Candidatus Omnitrophota bacterium]
MLASPAADLRLTDPTATVPPALARACEQAQRYLLSKQDPEGFWVAELEADTTLESDTIKLMHLLGRVDQDKQERLIRTILKNQLPDGGWPIYARGPAELNASVKAYAALKLSGRPADDPVLAAARRTILRLGGLARINSFEKVYLALFGCYPWEEVPALPPELVLLPNWFYFNLYEIAYWSRTILVPLAVVYATRPMAPQAALNLDELWTDPKSRRARITNLQKGGALWRTFFLSADRLLKAYERSPFKPLRRLALREADRWITDRLVETDGLGAIFPAMLNAVFALKGLGYQDGDPLFEKQIEELARLELADGDALKVQPCFPPIWDTALAMYALGKSGQRSPEQEGLTRAGQWLRSKEIRQWGDWRIKNPEGRPGGWAFEFDNPYYPDVDDTAQVLLGLAHSRAAAVSDGVFRRGMDWVLSMQNRDGGFSSFDKNNNRQALTHFPFADHNAMLDPSCPDITGRILELMSLAGFRRGHPALEAAVGYLHRTQETDGTWFGRWGVGFHYGTWLALRGLRSVGEPMESLRYQRVGRWFATRQNPDGGWGESCRAYDDPSVKGQGESTSSQTAWALMALMSLGQVAEPAFQRGIRWLLTRQGPEGDWPEGPFTGTGFPRVFYLKYHFYRIYFPLLALTEAREFFKE